MTTQPFPKTVNFYPLMGIQAARRASHMGGAWRAYVLAKALDVIGTGRVNRDELREYALSLGVNIRTWKRWLSQARACDLISDIQKGKDWYLILPAAGRAGLAMGMDNIGPRRASMEAGALIGTGWKARVFSAWEDGKQITREQIQKTINVSVSTQRYRDGQAGTLRQRNYSKSNIKAKSIDALEGIARHQHHKGAYILRDGFIAWRLPDTRTSKAATRGGKGRARKANAFIRNSNQKGLSNMRQALTDELKPDYIRLFNLTEAQRKATERKLSRRDLRVIELYQRAGEAKTGAVIWTHCPV